MTKKIVAQTDEDFYDHTDYRHLDTPANKRGTAKGSGPKPRDPTGPVQPLQLRITPTAKRKLEQLAAHSGRSQALVLEQAIDDLWVQTEFSSG